MLDLLPHGMRSPQEIHEFLWKERRENVGADRRRAGEVWPLALTPLGIVKTLTGPVHVYRFVDDGVHVVLDGLALQLLPAPGLEISDLQAEMDGAAWIASRQPVPLTTSMPGVAAVPPVEERKAAVAALAVAAGLSAPAVREGVYLRKDKSYLALVDGGGRTCAVGTTLPPVEAPFPELAPRRRLAIAVGRFLARKAAS